jgi:hypothetical protein
MSVISELSRLSGPSRLEAGTAFFWRRVRRISAVAAMACVGASALWAQGPQPQYTQRGGNNREGLYDTEVFLTPQNVNVTHFGNLGSFNVDGMIAGQPLYVPGVTIPGVGPVNVIYVATQNDSVYAFDADIPGSAPLWQTSLLMSGNGVTETAEPVSAIKCGGSGYSQIGVTSAPVIDLTTNTIYLVAKTMDVTNGATSYNFRLHALDITTGFEKFGGPTAITASAGSLTLKTWIQYYLQRPALLEANGSIYIGFGSNGCDKAAHGWLLAYNATTLQQQAVFNSSPDVAWGSSLWMSGVGPAADSEGNVYIITANGTFDIFDGGSDWGDTMLQMNGSTLAVTDSFTPFNQSTMATDDLDLGSGGPVLLPTQTVGPPNLLVSSGKTGTIYLVNTAPGAMGGYTAGGPDNVDQELPGAITGLWGAPAYWNNAIYFAGHSDYVKAFPFVNGIITTPPVQSISAYVLNGVPVISANSNSNGILWLVRNVTPTGTTTELSAFNASTLQTNLIQIYDTQMNSARDALGTAPHFAEPLVANGKVYVGTNTQLMVYGLFPALTTSVGNGQSATVNTPINLTAQAVNPYTGVGISGVTVTFSDGRGGVFNPASEITNSSGNAPTTYTLPTKAGTAAITASSTGYPSAVFTETAVAGPPATISTVSGTAQSGTVGTTLPNPLVAKAEDAYGNVVSNAQITFTDGTLNGSFQPNPATTLTNGEASTYLTLPTVARGDFPVTASSGSATTALFHATSVAGAAASIVIRSGNKQTGTPGEQLPNALMVTVKDQYGNGVPSMTVNFSGNGAGGTFSNSAPVTSSVGVASSLYTLPSVPGTWTITATAGGFSVNFTEIGN